MQDTRNPINDRVERWMGNSPYNIPEPPREPRADPGHCHGVEFTADGSVRPCCGRAAA